MRPLRAVEPCEPRTPYHTAPGDCVLHPQGGIGTWRGKRCTLLPMLDKRENVLARPTYRDCITVARTLGPKWRMWTDAEFFQLHKDALNGLAFEAKPCPLTMDAHDLACARDEGLVLLDAQGKPTNAYLNRHSEHMKTLRWYRRHDALFLPQLDGPSQANANVQRWDRTTPVSNAGKQWLHGAASGRALNFGWFLMPPWPPQYSHGMIQTRGTTHDAGHYDYSQLAMFIEGDAPAGGNAGGGGTGPLPAPPTGNDESSGASVLWLGLGLGGLFWLASKAKKL